MRAGLLACGLMLVIDAGVALASAALSCSACCRDGGCARRILSGGLIWTCKPSGIVWWAGYLLLAVCWKVSVAREKVEARFMVVLEFEMTLVAIAAVVLEVGGLLLRCGLRGCGGGGDGKLKTA